MNKERRKEIERLVTRLEEIKADISTVGFEEQDYADEMPENLHGSERHEKAEEVAADIDMVTEAIGEAIDGLNTATE